MTSHETWDVEIAAGVVHTMTLDELDAAYQGGHILEHTRVKQSRALGWSTLAAVAGLEDASASATPPPVSAPHSLAPQMLSAPPSAFPTDLDLAHGELDLDDLSADAFRSKKKPLVVVSALVGVLAIAAVVGLGVSHMSAAETQAAAAAAVVAAPPPAVTSLPAPAETASDKRALSDDQKRALAEADQKRVAEADKRRLKNAPRSSGAPRSKNDGLLKNGSKFDPLNGAL